MKSNSFKISNWRVCHLIILIISLLPLVFLLCCKGSGGNGDGKSPTSRKIFVTNSFGDTISLFDVDADGDVAPVKIIGSKTGLLRPQAIYLDTKNNELFVANTGNNTITVYRRTDVGDVSPLRTIGGENTGLLGPTGIFVDTDDNEVFVTDLFSIKVYRRTAEGNIPPLRTIEGENTKLAIPRGIFVDIENSEIFVVNSANNTVTVYARTANGNISPLRTLTILDTSDLDFQDAQRLSSGIFVDTKNDELFITDSTFSTIPSPVPIQQPLKSTIKVYRRTDEGDTLPLRVIQGENTTLFSPSGIFVDSNDIFVVNSFNNTVTVYGRTDNGDVSPLRILSILDSNNSGLRGTRGISSGIFLDSVNNQIYVVNRNDTITVYRREDKGDATPLRIIGPNTGLLEPNWIFVDTDNSEIFVSNSFSNLVTVYGTTDEGNIEPSRTISQGLLSPQGIYVDTQNNEIFVASNLGQRGVVTIYRIKDGAFLRTIFGANTGLSFPGGIFLDVKDNKIFVVNSGNSTITVYGRTDEGNVSPSKTIGGEDTGLFFPTGIFVDTENNKIFVTYPFLNTIAVYERTAAGDFSIAQTIDTELNEPNGIFVDTKNNQIFVANSGNNTITIYNITADGNVSLRKTIGGKKTGLSRPVGIFVAETP